MQTFQVPHPDYLLPKLHIRVELIFAAYPHLRSYNLSQFKTLEQLSVKLKRLAELENSINVFTVHNWLELSRETGDLFHLQLKVNAGSSTALAEIKAALQRTDGTSAWHNNERDNEIILSGSRREVLNQLGLCGAWLDIKTIWPLTVAQLQVLKAIENAKLEELLGDTRAALDLIISN
jgi:hypothetical protein